MLASFFYAKSWKRQHIVSQSICPEDLRCLSLTASGFCQGISSILCGFPARSTNVHFNPSYHPWSIQLLSFYKAFQNVSLFISCPCANLVLPFQCLPGALAPDPRLATSLRLIAAGLDSARSAKRPKKSMYKHQSKTTLLQPKMKSGLRNLSWRLGSRKLVGETKYVCLLSLCDLNFLMVLLGLCLIL